MKKDNPVGWFEIPVLDMDRAMRFYGQVFEVTFTKMEMPLLDMALFSSSPEGKGSSGALVCNKELRVPSRDGVLIYFTAYSGDVGTELVRVVASGGTILQPKQSIGQYGYVGIFLDTEGNRIGLHSRA